MQWISSDEPTIDRLACAWLIVRFIDQQAEVFFAPEHEVDDRIKTTGALAFDIAGVEFSSAGRFTAFDKLMRSYRFNNPALAQLADLIFESRTTGIQASLHKAGMGDLSEGVDQLLKEAQEMLQMGLNLFDEIYRRIREDILKNKIVPNLEVSRMLS